MKASVFALALLGALVNRVNADGHFCDDVAETKCDLPDLIAHLGTACPLAVLPFRRPSLHLVWV